MHLHAARRLRRCTATTLCIAISVNRTWWVRFCCSFHVPMQLTLSALCVWQLIACCQIMSQRLPVAAAGCIISLPPATQNRLHVPHLALHQPSYHPMQVRLDERHWMVIDLELAAPKDASPPADYRLADWDSGTLDESGRYTASSDMHQIGVMLGGFRVDGLSDAARAFIKGLVDKELDAAAALQHAWLRQRMLFSHCLITSYNLELTRSTA